MDDGEANRLACAEVVEEMGVLEHQDAEEQINLNLVGPIVLEDAAYHIVGASLYLCIA